MIFQQFQNLDSISESMRIMIFKIATLLSQLGSLMICTHDLTILTKTKEMIRYCESYVFGGKTLSAIISIILMELVYLQKMDKICP
jgi:hypothetical protein